MHASSQGESQALVARLIRRRRAGQHDDATQRASRRGDRRPRFDRRIFPPRGSGRGVATIRGQSAYGAPKYRRGGSHSGNVAARNWPSRALDILSYRLCSGQPHSSAFELAAPCPRIDLAHALRLVTKNPARRRAAERGEIASGKAPISFAIRYASERRPCAASGRAGCAVT